MKTNKFYKRILGLLLALSIFIGSSPLQAEIEEKQTFGNIKLSTNFVNLIGLGDLNVSVETKVRHKESIILGAHKNYDTQTNKYSGEQGGLIGYRIYPTLLSDEKGLSGEYFQLTFGTNKEENQYANSVEFWVGKSTYLGTNLGIEFGVGLGRKYKNNSSPMVLAGFNLIYSL